MPPLDVQVHVRERPADPAQLAAWRWLWQRLLAGNNPENSNAPRGERDALSDGSDPLARRTRGDA
jgi:hypothetical protein